MAIVQNPITGRTKKKFGSAVFSKQYGKNTMRTKPIEVSNPKSLKQRQQRLKFSLMVELARMFLAFIRIGFKQVSIEMSEFNSFMKFNILNVITGVYPDYTIDFTKLIVSKGTLTGADGGACTAPAGHKISTTWTDNSGYGDAQPTDKAMVLVLNYDKKGEKHETELKTRTDGLCEVILPVSWVGDDVHVYLSFITEAGDKVSDSVFLGTETVLA